MSVTRAGSPGVRLWSAVAAITLGMGAAVAISWLAFFRGIDTFGLDPESLVRCPRIAIYCLQFLLVGTIVFGLAHRWLRGMSTAALAVAIGSAWLLEGVILTVLGERFVANELDPGIAWYFWLVATAGPLQPLVAFLAGWAGLRHAAAREVGASDG